MTITVLMSVYRSERPVFLNKAIRSIMEEQTLLPNELVLVEDGPLSEELCAVIKMWKDKLGQQMTIITNKENLGLTKSLNQGIEIISSDLIARMDTDDISTPTRLELQTKFLESHPDIDILGGAILEIDENEHILNKRFYPVDNAAVLKSIYRANPIAHSTVMIRRRLFDNGLRYNEKYRTNQDLNLWFDAIYKGYKIANLDDVVLKFRRLSSVYHRRRKRKNLWTEFCIYNNGIRRIYGLCSFKYIYPLMRLFLKFMPTCVVKWAYESNIRRIVTEHNIQQNTDEQLTETE